MLLHRCSGRAAIVLVEAVEPIEEAIPGNDCCFFAIKSIYSGRV
jgi:hypothetical protein